MLIYDSSMCTTLAHPTPTTFPHHVQRSNAETDRDGRLSVKGSGAEESGRRERCQSGTYTGRERERRARTRAGYCFIMKQ